MSYTPIVTRDEAEALNRKVQQVLDPRLFLVCNYSPTPGIPLGEDSRFLYGVQDLYKFAVDSSGIIKNFKFVTGCAWQYFSVISQVLDEVGVLRSVLDHSQDPLNGMQEEDTLTAYTTWMQSLLSKPAPATNEDYRILNEELALMKEDLVQELERQLDYIAGSYSPSRKQDVVSKWIDKTLYWYSNNTKTAIYTGTLMGAYNSKATMRNAYFMEDIYAEGRGLKPLKRKALDWAQAGFASSFDRRISDCQQLIDSKSQVLAAFPASPIFSTMPEPERQRFVQMNETALNAARTRLHRLDAERNQFNAAVQKNQQSKYLFDHLADNLRETMRDLEREGVSYTLLPQDLMQEDIERRFGSTPSPDGDF